MNKVIIDTSAWIESFRSQGDELLGQNVKNFVLKGVVLLPGIIQVEILRGAKSTKEYMKLNDLLKGLLYLPVPEKFWDRLSAFSFDLFRKGISVPLTDAYIALLCIENDASILHRDKHFNLIAKKFPLKVL